MKRNSANASYLYLILVINLAVPLLFLLYLLRLNSFKELNESWASFTLLGLNFITALLEALVFLIGAAFLIFKKFKLFKILAVCAAIFQLLLVTLLLLPVTRNQIAVFNYSFSLFGVNAEQRIPLGLLKTDYKAPEISFTSPSNFDLTEKGLATSGISGDSFNVSVDVTDDSFFKRTSFGDFVQSPLTVTIDIDNSKVKTFSSPPYIYSWNLRNVSKGQHKITATAIDSEDNSSNVSTYLKVN